MTRTENKEFKAEVETLDKKMAELSEDEIDMVSGGRRILIPLN